MTDMLSGLESGTFRATRLQIDLRNQLSGRFVWLHALFEDASFPRVRIRRLAGHPLPGTRWRVLVLGRADVLLTIALPTSLTDGALHVPNHTPSWQLQALAASVLAPLLPHLRSFFEQELELRVQDGWESEAVAGPSLRFLVNVASEALDLTLPCFLSEAFAPRLIHLLKRRRSSFAAIDAPVSLFVGNQLRVPVRELLQLQESDVLMCDQVLQEEVPQTRLYLQSADALQAGRYLATVRAESGRVEHLAPGGWTGTGLNPSPGMPLAAVDAIEARLTLPATRCRRLAIGEYIDGWKDTPRLEPVQLFVAGRLVAQGRCTFVAGRGGYEILQIHRPTSTDLR